MHEAFLEEDSIYGIYEIRITSNLHNRAKAYKYSPNVPIKDFRYDNRDRNVVIPALPSGRQSIRKLKYTLLLVLGYLSFVLLPKWIAFPISGKSHCSNIDIGMSLQ